MTQQLEQWQKDRLDFFANMAVEKGEKIINLFVHFPLPLRQAEKYVAEKHPNLIWNFRMRTKAAMEKEVKITISGPQMTGKTVLAGKIAKALTQEGYKDVKVEFSDPIQNRDIENQEPFASYPITIVETN